MKKYYGIDLATYKLPAKQKELIKKLFLSLSLHPAEADEILSKVDDKKIDELLKILTEETEGLHKIQNNNSRFRYNTSYHDHDKQFVGKLKEWYSYFGELTENEIKEYIDYYNLPPQLLVGMKKRGTYLDIRSPQHIIKELDNYIVGHTEAKKRIAFSFYLQLLKTGRITPEIRATDSANLKIKELPDPSLLLVGPKGTGKVFIIQSLAEILGMNFVRFNVGFYSRPEEFIQALNYIFPYLFHRSERNVEKFENSVIFVDGIDKLCESYYGRDDKNPLFATLQQSLISFIEEQSVTIPLSDKDEKETITLPLDKMMFVFSGVFEGLDEIVKKRLGVDNGFKIGFSKDSKKEKKELTEPALSSLVPKDLISYGIIPQLVAKMNHSAFFSKRTKTELVGILKNDKNSSLQPFNNFFELHLDSIEIEDDVYDLIAERAMEIEGGTEYMNVVLHRLLDEYLYKSPNKKPEKFKVTKSDFFRVFSKEEEK